MMDPTYNNRFYEAFGEGENHFSLQTNSVNQKTGHKKENERKVKENVSGIKRSKWMRLKQKKVHLSLR